MFWFVWGCFVFAIQIELSCSFTLSWFNPVAGGGGSPIAVSCFLPPPRKHSKFNSSVRLMYIIVLVTALSLAFTENVFPIFCQPNMQQLLTCNNCINPLRDASHYATILLYRIHFFQWNKKFNCSSILGTIVLNILYQIPTSSFAVSLRVYKTFLAVKIPFVQIDSVMCNGRNKSKYIQ